MADGADLAQAVGDGEAFGGAGEELAPEIRARAVAQQRNFAPVVDLPAFMAAQEK